MASESSQLLSPVQTFLGISAPFTKGAKATFHQSVAQSNDCLQYPRNNLFGASFCVKLSAM